MSRIILFNKPYGVLSQFTAEGQYAGLDDYIDAPGFYAAGRLDATSEGLLVLSNNGQLQARISSPKYKLPKIYLVQVEGLPTQEALLALSSGVQLNDGLTLPAKCELIPEPKLWARYPPIRTRKNIPTSWLKIQLREGRNRQVRRMTATVGYPTLRLVRISVGNWHLGNLSPGQWKFVKTDSEDINIG